MKLETKPTEENSFVSTPKLTRAEFLAILYEERAKIVESGVSLLSWEQLDCELAERRGGEDNRENEEDVVLH